WGVGIGESLFGSSCCPWFPFHHGAGCALHAAHPSRETGQCQALEWEFCTSGAFGWLPPCLPHQPPCNPLAAPLHCPCQSTSPPWILTCSPKLALRLASVAASSPEALAWRSRLNRSTLDVARCPGWMTPNSSARCRSTSRTHMPE